MHIFFSFMFPEILQESLFIISSVQVKPNETFSVFQNTEEENMKKEFEHWDDAVSCGQHNARSCAGKVIIEKSRGGRFLWNRN